MAWTVSQLADSTDRAPSRHGHGRGLTWGVAWGVALLFALGTLGCGTASHETPVTTAMAPRTIDAQWPPGPRPQARLAVEGFGTVVVELYPSLAPQTVAQFLTLAENGFYDGTRFHRVIPDFMIQGGDPLSRRSASLTDSPNENAHPNQNATEPNVPDEFSEAAHQRGVLSLANQGRTDSGGSQFFIVQRDAPHLDGGHTVFGRVVSGLEVVDAIAATETDTGGRWGPAHQPLRPIVIESLRPVTTPSPIAQQPTGPAELATPSTRPQAS